MRIFIGLQTNVSLADNFKKICSHLQNRYSHHKKPPEFYHHEDLHITLHFLGTISERQFNSLDFLEPMARKIKGFELTVNEIGSFPTRDKSRGLWLAVHPDPKLMALEREVGAALSDRGFTPDPRPYVPHMTICRFPSAIHLDDRSADITPNEVPLSKVLEPFLCKVEHLNIYKSVEDRKDLRYQVLERY